MAIPTVALNEATPAGSAYVRDGDDRIKEFKTQVREVLGVDHDFPSSGNSASVGRHKWVTLKEVADIGTGADGVPILGAQLDGVVPELVYTDEANKDVQITKGGLLNLNDVTLASLAVLMAFVYPVGSLYYNATVSTNPGTLLGFGTWTAFGAGKVVVGINAVETEFDVLGETGGEKTHVLVEAELAAHVHTVTTYDNGTDGVAVRSAGATGTTRNVATSSVGSGTAHNNLQPYIVVYIWKRTA